MERESEKGREGVCHCGLTSSTVEEGLTDSTAKYNVLETWALTAINSNRHHIYTRTHKHKYTQEQSAHSSVPSSVIRLFLTRLTASEKWQITTVLQLNQQLYDLHVTLLWSYLQLEPLHCILNVSLYIFSSDKAKFLKGAAKCITTKH